MSLKRLIANLALTAAAVLLSVGAVEAGLHLFSLGGASETVTGDQYDFYHFDPQLGWASSPGKSGTFARAEFSYPMRINSLGLRGPEIERGRKAGVHRIAVIGDSFTWGIGASEPELFTTLLQDAIPDSEVLNFGVSGYSPVQYNLMTSQVLDLDPDLVVIAFCLGNDFIDNVQWWRYGYYKPYAELDDQGNLRTTGYPIPDIRRWRLNFQGGATQWLFDHSFLVRLIDREVVGRVSQMLAPGQKGLPMTVSQVYTDPDSPAVAEAIKVNTKLFEQIVKDYASRGVPIVVLAVPTKCEVGKCPEGSRPDSARRALAASLAGLPVTLIDPTTTFSLDDFWNRDGHWRPSGHRKAAAALVPAVTDVLGTLSRK